MLIVLSIGVHAFIGGPLKDLTTLDGYLHCQGIHIYVTDNATADIIFRNVTKDSQSTANSAYLWTGTSTSCDDLQQIADFSGDLAEFVEDDNVTFSPGSWLCIAEGSGSDVYARVYNVESSYPFFDGYTNTTEYAISDPGGGCTPPSQFNNNVIINIFKYEFDLVVSDTDPPAISSCICTSNCEDTNETTDSTPTINCTVTDVTGVFGVWISNNSAFVPNNLTEDRAGTKGTCVADSTDCTWIFTLASADQLTNLGQPQTLYLYANDTLGNAQTTPSETIDVTYTFCNCPLSGDWLIQGGQECTLSSVCSIGSNKFRVLDGKMRINPSGFLRAGGCFVNDSQSFFVDDGGGLFCG